MERIGRGWAVCSDNTDQPRPQRGREGHIAVHAAFCNPVLRTIYCPLMVAAQNCNSPPGKLQILQITQHAIGVGRNEERLLRGGKPQVG